MNRVKESFSSIKNSIGKNIKKTDIVNKSKQFIEKNKNNKKLIIIIVIILTVVVLSFGYLIYKYSQSNVSRVQFFKHSQPTNISKNIPQRELFKKTMGEEYSFSMWFRINNWYTNTSTPGLQHIFTFGDSALNNGIPSVFLKNDINDIVIKVKTSDPTPIQIYLKTVPIKKWFKLTIVMKPKSIQVYLNSKLDVFKLLPSRIVSPATGVQLFNDKKIDGHFSNFTFYSKALSPSEVSNLYDIGDKPTKQSLLYKIINVFLNIGSYRYDKKLTKKETSV